MLEHRQLRLIPDESPRSQALEIASPRTDERVSHMMFKRLTIRMAIVAVAMGGDLPWYCKVFPALCPA